MIKVCVINPDFYRSSGVTTAIKKIYDSLKIYNVEFIFIASNNKLNNDEWIPKEKYYKYNIMSKNPFIVLKNLLKISLLVRKINVDIIHVHHRRIFIILKIFQYLFKSKIVYSANLSYKFNFLFWLFSPDNVIAVTKSVEENVIRTTRTLKSHISIIGNPTDFPVTIPNNYEGVNKNLAVCIARLEPVKGHEYLLKAWSILKNEGKNYELQIIGEGKLKCYLQELSLNLKINDLVSFVGYKNEINTIFEKCLFNLLVSQVEGQGIVTIEAAANLRASILTDVDGSRDCLPPNKKLYNGVKYGDIYILARTIDYWFSNPEKVFSEGVIFYEFHKSINSTNVIGKKYFEYYQNLRIKN
jgi:glycosyltransferase involved in cell wall biosynthesis